MRGAIASVEIFVFEAAGSAGETGETGSVPGRPRRLSLVIGLPERAAGSESWQCRVALADLHRPETFEGCDSIEALFRAVERARSWLAALEAEGCWLARDRAGTKRLGAPFLS